MRKKDTFIDSLFERDPQKEAKLQDQISLQKQQTMKKREEFLNAMSETLLEDKNGDNFGKLTNVQKQTRYLEPDGTLTQEFRYELKELKLEELENLEQSIKDARVPTKDLFGVERRFCSVCEQGCIGYEPNKNLFSTLNSTSFPTFCKNCRCPAHFHTMAFKPENIEYPENLQQILQDHNIKAKDLNYNCVLVAFQIRSEEKEIENTYELQQILHEEGYEILRSEARKLDFEEAIFLKSRMVNQTENMIIFAKENDGFSSQDKTSQEIKKQGQMMGSTTIMSNGQRDLFQLEKYTREKEIGISKAHQQMQGQKSEGYSNIYGIPIHKDKQQPLDQNFDTFKAQKLNSQNLKNHSINQRINNTSNMNKNPSVSIARSSNVDSLNERQSAALNVFPQRRAVAKNKKDSFFKVTFYNKNSYTKKANIVKRVSEDEQEDYLMQQFEHNPLLRELFQKEILILVLSSASHQNLQSRLTQKSPLMQKIQQFLPLSEMPLLYVSENKVVAIEDTLFFFPQIYQLTKSIVIAEPQFDYAKLHSTGSVSVQFRSKLDPQIDEIG